MHPSFGISKKDFGKITPYETTTTKSGFRVFISLWNSIFFDIFFFCYSLILFFMANSFTGE